MTTSDALLVRDWLRAHCIGCPRCGGANKGYSTWTIRNAEVICDNCFFPAPSGQTKEGEQEC